MELHQLQIFVTVTEEKSITRAAKRLYTTPSTISGHIKTLETELGVQLFIRTKQGMVITSKGEALRDKALTTLHAAQSMLDYATEETGTIRLGLCSDPVFLKIPALIRQLQHVELQLEKSSSADILRDVAANKLDVGFVFGDVASGVHLADVELVVAAPKGWDVITDWEALVMQPWISVGDDCPFNAVLGQRMACPQQIQINDDHSRYDLVVAGVGLSLLERTIAEQGVAEGLMSILPVEPLSCRLSLVYNDHELARRVVALLIQQFL